MATIQMINDEVIDVKESGSDVLAMIMTAAHSVIELTALDDNGEHQIWINPNQISSFM